MARRLSPVLGAFGILAASCGSSMAGTPLAHGALAGTFLVHLQRVTQIASTVPSNGDLNPYGVAVVPASSGRLVAGDMLVTNFNDRRNVQGTGTTIVEVSPTGESQSFAQLAQLPPGASCPGGIGLTLALGVLPGGWVIAGSLPTNDDGDLPRNDPAGCLVVLNDEGSVVETFTNQNLDGPWDLTVRSTSTSAVVFVTNALGPLVHSPMGGAAGDVTGQDSGDAEVVRLDLALSESLPPKLVTTTVIGTRFPWTANNAALVLAPTGLVLGRHGTLYVDDADTNAVYEIPDANTRLHPVTAGSVVLSSGGSLNQPLGMALTPTGDLVIVNGNDGDAVELNAYGKQLDTKVVVRNGTGDLIGLSLTPAGSILFGNDATNALDLLSR